jgi:hypothetical protein
VPKSLPLLLCRLALCASVMTAVYACQSTALPETITTAGAAGLPSAAAGAPEEASAGQSSGGAEGAATTSLVVLERERITSDPEADSFQRASARVDFGTGEVAKATLRVSIESPCFPFAGWVEQGVPDGQRWPERCDAFDRTLSVSLDDPADAGAGPPGIELLRAVTPFGGPLELSADITDVVNGLPGEHELRVRIDTWSDADGLVSGSKGEWLASASVELEAGTAPRRVLSVKSLVLETQTEVDAQPITFEAPAGASSARLEYRVTGHGGVPDFQCIGPAEEFCRRTHELRIDDALIAELTPWRSDCDALCTLTKNDAAVGPASYCAENPCGDPRSVRAPRANWCPGSATPPFLLEDPSLVVAGEHELTRSVLELKPGAGWQVSVTYFAFE